MTKLKPCPFCGGEAETDSYKVLFSHRIQNYIRCSKCYCMLEIGENATPSELIEHWNKRYEPTLENKCTECGNTMKFVSLDGRSKSVGYFECKECGCQTNILWHKEPKSQSGAYTPARSERLKE